MELVLVIGVAVLQLIVVPLVCLRRLTEIRDTLRRMAGLEDEE